MYSRTYTKIKKVNKENKNYYKKEKKNPHLDLIAKNPSNFFLRDLKMYHSCKDSA